MHFYVVKAKTLKIIGIFILLFALMFVNVSSNSVCAEIFVNKEIRKIPIYCVKTDEKKIAITFDAAWGSDKTKSILNILKENDVVATFFLVGMWVDKYPEMVKLIDESNCEIGTHSNTHPDLTKLSQSQIKLELESSIEKINKITGKDVKVFRAPFGAYNNNLLNIAESLSLQTIQWDVDSLDWKGISDVKICENVFRKVKNGSIILCHNNSDYIVEALPNLILGLKERGYEFVCVGDLTIKDNFTIDVTGMQISN